MSWFQLKDQKKRNLIKGIWLRPTSNPDVIEEILKSKLMRKSEAVKWIEIKELRENNEVLLEVWCSSFTDMLLNKRRSNVFYIQMKENPEWICEGDLGRGLK